MYIVLFPKLNIYIYVKFSYIIFTHIFLGNEDFSVGTEEVNADIFPERQVGVGEYAGDISLSSEGITFGSNATANETVNHRKKRDTSGSFFMEPGRSVVNVVKSTCYYYRQSIDIFSSCLCSRFQFVIRSERSKYPRLESMCILDR